MRLRVVILLVLVPFIAFAQTIQYHGPDDVDLASDLIEGKDNRLFVSTTSGMYFSDDFAGSWQRVDASFNTPYSTTTFAELRTGELFAADYREILSTTDNGDTWKTRKMIQMNSYVPLRSIGIGGDTLWVGTYLGLFYTSSGNIASSLRPVQQVPLDEITSLHVEGNLLLAATRENGLHRSDNGGTTWAAVKGGLPERMNASGLLITAGRWYVYGSDGTYTSADNGASWQPLELNTSFLYGLYNDNGQLWAITDKNEIWRQSQGSDWAHAGGNLPDSFKPRKIWAHGGIVVVAGASGIYKSVNGGIDYQPAFKGIQDAQIFSTLDVAPDGSLWAMASSTGVYKMASGDNTFRSVLNGQGYYAGGMVTGDTLIIVRDGRIDFLSTATGAYDEPLLSDKIVLPEGFTRAWGDLFVVSLGRILRYDGNAWATYNDGLPNTAMGQIRFHNDRLFAATDAGLYARARTDDHWTPVRFSDHALGARQLFVDGDLFVVSSAGSFATFLSTDAGAHWQAIPEMANESVGAFTAHEERIYAASNRKLFVSSPDKQSWTTYDLPDIFPTALRMHNDRLYVATWERGIWSFDKTWFERKPQEILTSDENFVVLKDAPIEVVASASSGLPVTITLSTAFSSGPATLEGTTLTVLGYPTVYVDVFQEGSDEYLPARKVLRYYVDLIAGISEGPEIAVFPNPATRELFITDASATDATVSVVDVQGRVLVSEGFTGEARLDVSGIPAGVYVVMVKRAGEVRRVKVMKR